jgi:hypothetical protein
MSLPRKHSHYKLLMETLNHQNWLFLQLTSLHLLPTVPSLRLFFLDREIAKELLDIPKEWVALLSPSQVLLELEKYVPCWLFLQAAPVSHNASRKIRG